MVGGRFTFHIVWLGEALNAGLRKFSQDIFAGNLEIRFAFESFPAEFKWPGCTNEELRTYCRTARRTILEVDCIRQKR